VAPGFIDAHSHNEFFADRDNAEKYFAPFLRQGITTQITGNCGFSPFGVSADSPHKGKVGGGLFGAKTAGGFSDFVKDIAGRLHVNMAPLIGHGSIRTGISGYDHKPLNQEQIQEMLRHADEAMENGAFGGSLGFMYVPGMYSKKDEIMAFARRVAKYDGILTVHPRACSKVALGYPLLFSKPHIELGLDEVAEIAKQTGVRTEYSHLIFIGKSTWNSCRTMLEKFRKLNEQGLRIAYDNYAFPYGASVITVILPAWYMALPDEKRRDPFVRFKLKLIINVTKKLLGLDFCDFTVAYISDEHRQYEGKTVEQCAKEEGLEPFDMYIKLAELSRDKGRIFAGKYYNEDIILTLMKDDLSVFMTDAWVEETGVQNASAFQCFPYFLVRARQHKFPLEAVIHKMTGKTAERFQIRRRGILAAGNYADITVFDYGKLHVEPDVPDFTPQGIRYVFVNGVAAVDDGVYRPSTSGQIILKRN
jgi:N-acyl-D-amino-acid deacylase